MTSAIQGDALNPDGFALSLDGGPAQPLGPNASLTLAGLPAGSRTLRLSGLAPNCTLSSPNPLTATVPAGGTARVAFEVGCSAPGALEVITATSGQDLDPDGYAASVDGGAEVAISVNGSTTIADLSAGSHSVRLSGMTPNCTLRGPNPLTACITAGGRTQVNIDVACGACHRERGSGTRIAFAHRHDYNPLLETIVTDICTITPDGLGFTNLTRATTSFQSYAAPAWSPDGARLAFWQFVPGSEILSFNVSIGTMRADGGGRTVLTGPPVHSAPVWSPDGREIAFASGDRRKAPDIGIVPVSGGQARIPAPSAAYDFPTSWR